jgi:ribonucleoside-diphosphate reductase alpha chain
LPPYGACLLGSINLARLVTDAFEKGAALDGAALDGLVTTAVRMMDNVIDVSKFPLEAQAQEARAKRRIGLGVTGLADALLMVGLRYGSDKAARQTSDWLRRISRAAYLASVDLAREKGAFPLFDADAYLASGTIMAMDPDVREAISTHGIRNALLTSIAPTGTISLYAGNVSSGIEPVFAYSYTRKVLQKDGARSEEEVEDYAVALWREKFGDAPLPDHFATPRRWHPPIM